jgi:hypothetical protein
MAAQESVARLSLVLLVSLIQQPADIELNEHRIVASVSCRSRVSGGVGWCGVVWCSSVPSKLPGVKGQSPVSHIPSQLKAAVSSMQHT